MKIQLEHVADEDLLKVVWRKEVRPALRSMTFSNFNLAHDPIHYAGYEWGLTTLVAALAREIRLGAYAPERGEVVRSAKGKGLSRPLCFLATRDALVYRTITWLARDQLVTGAQEWVGFRRADKGSVGKNEDRSGSVDSTDWFRFWLARQGLVLKMIDDGVPYFVESDIANFYPSIRIEAIREHLHSQTDLQKEVVRLCCQIIDGVMPRRDYSEVSLMGLPQEQIGSSRDIAHSLLLPVDQEFMPEGEGGKYTRFMDDILIGVDSGEDGEICIGRLQRSLEALGLYPNAAKTMVVPVSQYLVDSMVETNAAIDRLEALLSDEQETVPHVYEPDQELIDEVASLSEDHRSLTIRPRRWDRVMRRLYTLHRKIGYKDWWGFWRDDVTADPGSAGALLEYVRSWPLSAETVRDLAGLSAACSHLYPNISLLAAEALMSAPTPVDSAVWNHAFEACSAEITRLLEDNTLGPEGERMAAAWLFAGWKFGTESQRHALLSRLPNDLDASSPVRSQALPLLVAAGRSITEWVAAKPGLAWENALGAEYLRSLLAGEDRAVGIAISLIQAELRLTPQRFVVLPRSLPLAQILLNGKSVKLARSAPKILEQLKKNPDRLRDFRTESLIAQF